MDPLIEQMLAKGSLLGPYRRCRPIRYGLVRRLIALLYP